MRTAQIAAGACLSMLASIASGQESGPEVTSVTVNTWVIASDSVRTIALLHELDLNNDQYLSEDEIEPALRIAATALANEMRHRDMQAQRNLDSSYSLHRNPRIGSAPLVPTRRTSRPGGTATAQRLARLRFVSQELYATGSYEISLVSEEFHRLFAGLPGEQRAALLEADVDGNNDGTVTVREFYAHTRRLLSSKSRFEADFGEAAYVEVLRRFGVL